jgi:hypothetical protein
MMDKKKLSAFIATNYPAHAEEIQEFRNQLNRLLILGVGGFVLIVIIYILLKFNAQ